MRPAFVCLLTCLAPGLLSACSERTEDFAPDTAVYQCKRANDTFLLVTRSRSDGMGIFLPPGNTPEPYQILTRGEADRTFVNDHIRLTFYDGGASLSVLDLTDADCGYDRRASIWEHAKLNGVDFRGTGNEPGWVLEVRERDRLDFEYDYGASSISAKILSAEIIETDSDPEIPQTRYLGQGGSGELVVTLTGEDCADTMSDETFPTRVEVEFGDRTFQGCGRPLH